MYLKVVFTVDKHWSSCSLEESMLGLSLMPCLPLQGSDKEDEVVVCLLQQMAIWGYQGQDINPLYTVPCRYNTVNFLQNPHIGDIQ